MGKSKKRALEREEEFDEEFIFKKLTKVGKKFDRMIELTNPDGEIVSGKDSGDQPSQHETKVVKEVNGKNVNKENMSLNKQDGPSEVQPLGNAAQIENKPLDLEEFNEKRKTIMANSDSAMSSMSNPSNESQWNSVSSIESEDILSDSLDLYARSKSKLQLQRSEVENEQSFITTEETTETSQIDNSNNIESITHTSFLSEIGDVEEHLREALLENKKLKSILNQKDDAIRKQFNTIVTLEKEMIKVCEDYNKKFSEIKEIIKHLKCENNQLRETIISNDINVLSSDKCEDSSKSADKENILLQASAVQPEDTVTTPYTKRELHLIEKIKDLSQKLNTAEADLLQTQSKLNEQMKKSFNELETLKQNIKLPSDNDLLKLIDEQCKKDLEIKYLANVIKLLEEKNQDFKENNTKDNNELSKIRNHEKKLKKDTPKENLEAYNEKFRSFINCFTDKCIHYLDIKCFPKKCVEIIETFNNALISTSIILKNDNKMQEHRNKFIDSRKILIEDQLRSINDERITMNVQRHFMKILSDYNNVVDQLDILKNKNTRLGEVNYKISKGEISSLAQIEKCLEEEKKISDNERKVLLEERTNIEKEKQALREEWEWLEAERIALMEEKDQILEESKRIFDQNVSHDEKSKIVKDKESPLEKVNTDLQERFNQTTTELNSTKEELNEAREIVVDLRDQISKLLENEDAISAYKLQMEMQDTEIFMLRDSEKNYLHQIENLSTEIEQIRNENEQLRNRNVQQNPNQNLNQNPNQNPNQNINFIEPQI